MHTIPMKYQAKSIVMGRKPLKEGNEYKTLFVNIYDEPEAHKNAVFPIKEVEIENIEKTFLGGMQPIFFLEGADLIWPHTHEIEIIQEGHKVFVHVV